jgi:uncharacterized protein (TIGR02231 family)
MVSKLFIRKNLFALACATFVSLLPAFGFSADVVPGKISKVRLYTDRAEITRSIKRKILAGKSQFSVGPLPDSVRPNSVRVSLIGNSSARLVNVKTSRDYGGNFLSDEITKQEKIVQSIKKELRATQDLLKTLDLQLDFINLLVNLESEKGKPYSNGINSNQTGPKDWDQTLKFVSTRGTQLHQDRRKAEDSLAEIGRQLKAAKKKLQDLQSGIKKTAHRVILDWKSPSESISDIEITYQVSNTRWKPVYQLSADTEKKSLTVLYQGEIIQRTGEDWENVKMELSTGRPSLGGAPPNLSPWVVDFLPPPPKVRKLQRKMLNAPMAMDSVAEMESAPMMVAGAAVTETGTSLIYTLLDKQTISSGVSDHRSTIVEKKFPIDLNYISIPKRSAFVYLNSKTINKSPFHFLQGRGWIYLNKSFVGTVWMNQTAPEQELKLGLGADEGIKVERKLIRKEGGEEGLFDKKDRLRYIYEIQLENFKKSEILLTLKDQLPLSYHENIEVKTNDISPTPKKVDEKNIITWEINLKPNEKKTVRIDYQVEYPAGKAIKGL